MKREILISVDHDETRIAIIEEGEVAEFFVERPLYQRTVGNIYLGRVENVLPGMQAAFVDIGLERNAFLFVDDARPPSGEDGVERQNGNHPSIRDLVKPGEEILVQVVKEPTGTKGARISRNLTIPGRYLVLMPSASYIGVSRRITSEEERTRLRALATRVRPKGLGLIVRTAAEGRSLAELREDARHLRAVWKGIGQVLKGAKAPALIHKDPHLAAAVLRDHLTRDTEAILVDDPEEYQRTLEAIRLLEPELEERTRLDHGDSPLFERYRVEEAISRALSRRVWLRSGGYLVIDQAEALTVIDVNTGRFVGTTDLADTVLKTNLEAAREIARQLRLREIGGIIVIDFIDMDVPAHRQEVLQALGDALQRDRRKSSVLGITQLGLVEMTRKKGRQSLQEVLMRPCPTCNGHGRISSEETIAGRFRRTIVRLLRESDKDAILVEMHPSVAALLIGPGGAKLRAIEQETGRSVYIRGAKECGLEEMHVKSLGSRDDVEAMALPVRAGEVMELRIQEPHAAQASHGIGRIQGYVIDVEGGADHVGKEVRVEIVRAFRTYAKARIVS